MRSLGATNFGGAAPGEVFAVRAAIRDGDVRAWPIAFETLGRSIAAQADHAKARGHAVSARDHFLRASMYYRAAEYFSNPFSQEMRELGLTSRRAFLAAAALMTDRIEPVEVPYEGTSLPGYFMIPQTVPGAGHTIVILTGFDGTGEELYFRSAACGFIRS